MLRFEVYHHGVLVDKIDLTGAYLFGQDRIPIRAELSAAQGQISCVKRMAGPAGLSLLWEAGDAGKLMLSTTRLPERGEPYNLNVELARSRIMQLLLKREDWGLFDFDEAAGLNEQMERIRQLFVEALKADEPGKAATIADRVLAQAITFSERMSLFHAEIFNRRRKGNPAMPRLVFGCLADLDQNNDRYRQRLLEVSDFVSLPVAWKQLAPKERTYQWDVLDEWLNWASLHHRAVHAGPLVSFDPVDVPEWLYLFEHDYEALRDTIYEHLQSVVQRYEKKIRVWRVLSGLHAYNSFNLGFEQIMELTRLSCSVVKRVSPKGVAIIDLVLPWGEYYARNQRTIPPLLYADMCVQSGVKFDAFGLQLYLGAPRDGSFVRDLMQISALLDEFAGFGLPLQITGVQVPSEVTPETTGAMANVSPADAGRWHQDWNPRLQAEWLAAFARVAMSKPFVESLCWRDVAETANHFLPHGGLCKDDLTPKLSFRELRNFRASLIGPEEASGEGPRPLEPRQA